MRGALPLLFLALAASPVRAQATGFLRPDRWQVVAGERISLSFHALDGGPAVLQAWPERFDWFFVRTAGDQQNLEDPREPVEGAGLDLELVNAGIALVAADRTTRVMEVPATALRVYLSAKGVPPPESIVEAAGTLRVRRIESTKALVRVLGKEGFLPNSATAQSKTGQAVEIRPLADPTSVPVRSDLPLRVYLPGPRAGVRVTARHLPTGRTQTFPTDSAGTGFFTVTAAGVWTVEAHGLRPAVDGAADWELCSATLSFEVPAGDPRQGAGR